MSGVGKVGLVVLLVFLCAPVAARVSRHAGLGQGFSLPRWLMNVCHHRQPPRGTQRRGSHHPGEPLNALVEQQSRSESTAYAVRPAAEIGQAVAVPAFVPRGVGRSQPAPIPDSAFLCTFLI